ncbi:MAG: hypothetical protein A2252_05445 [Elusimicrobia bacterium RIFOXYA2_FULL_39_19]|nr:MAG: hypothetical protein A2252_05445 [Elusimicrobia bacterium RIFOXYA2_FULL_39_19]
MKTRILHILTILLITAGLNADLLENSSVISRSMGGCACPGDISSVALNPAMSLQSYQCTFSGSNYLLYDNARFNMLCYQQRFPESSLSILFARFQKDNIEIRQNLADEPKYTYDSEMAAILNYSLMLPLNIAAGINFKTYSIDIYNYKSNNPLGLDIGIYRNIFQSGEESKNRFSIGAGVAVSNFITPKLIMCEQSETYKTKSRISTEFKMTLSPHFNQNKASIDYDTLILNIDYIKNIMCGLEYKKGNYACRIGYNPDLAYKVSGGMGMYIGDIAINYSFTPFIDYGLHYLEMVYKFGEKVESEIQSEDIDEQRILINNTRSLYSKCYQEALSMIDEGKYEESVILLERIMPLEKENPKAKELIKICNTKISYGKIKAINTDFSNALNTNDIKSAYHQYFMVLDIDPFSVVSTDMNEKLRGPEIESKITRDTKDFYEQYVETIVKNIDKYLSKNNFDKAENEIIKLNLLEPRNKNTALYIFNLNEQKARYINSLMDDGLKYCEYNEYEKAYLCYKAAYKISGEKELQDKIRYVRVKYSTQNEIDTSQMLNHQKQYYQAALAFAKNESTATDLFTELKRANITYDFDLLETMLMKHAKIKP